MEGHGFSSSVPLQILIVDNNDNPPIFQSKNYTFVIEEGAMKFKEAVFVKVC